MAEGGAAEKRAGHGLVRLADELDRLALKSIELWLETGFAETGGAHGFLDRRWTPQCDGDGVGGGPSGEVRGEQTLIQQSRHLFAFSFVESRRPGDPRVRSAAHHLFRHLERRFLRGAGQAAIHRIDRFGMPGSEAVQLYAQGFCIYGLATYALTFDDHRAAQFALDLFCFLDQLRHDPLHAGYDQREDGDWLAQTNAPAGAAKCTNTHIHLLEALMPLAELFPREELVVRRLQELTLLISGRLLQTSGYVHKHFSMDWTPVGAPDVSYGHDLETSWLLRAAAATLANIGMLRWDTDVAAKRAAQLMAEHALRTGWDPQGGVFDHGVPEGQKEAPRVVGREKIWWAQAETLPALYQSYRDVPNEQLVARMERTLRFMTEQLWDADYGGFYWGVDPDGTLGPRGDHKGEIWKTPYHAVRAFLLVADWIREDS